MSQSFSFLTSLRGLHILNVLVNHFRPSSENLIFFYFKLNIWVSIYDKKSMIVDVIKEKWIIGAVKREKNCQDDGWDWTTALFKHRKNNIPTNITYKFQKTDGQWQLELGSDGQILYSDLIYFVMNQQNFDPTLVRIDLIVSQEQFQYMPEM